MQNNWRKILVNFFLFPITLLVLILYIYFSFTPKALPQPVLAYLDNSENQANLKNPYCKKNPNKKIDAKFSQVINLAKQRLENSGTDASYLNDLVDCADIRYSILNNKFSDDKIEGKFETLEEKEISEPVRISIDQSYQKKDDLLLAFVLIHELTHAKQYFDFQKTWELKSCLDREAESFNMEVTLFLALNSQEQKLLLSQIENNENEDVTLKTLERLINISAKSAEKCQDLSAKELLDCFEKNNLEMIKGALLLNKNYIAQCSA